MAEEGLSERPIRRSAPATTMVVMSNVNPTPPPPPASAPSTPGAPFAPPPHGRQFEGEKSFLATWLCALLLGVLGVDRFYLGKVGTGILKLVTFGGLGVWALIDLIMVLANATRDAKGNALAGYQEHRRIAWIVTSALVVVSLISSIVGGGAAQRSADALAETPSVSAQEPAQESAEPPASEQDDEPAEEPVEQVPAEPEIPAEYSSALVKAQSYAELMHMSKAGIYDQLTSQYGEKFSPEAAQYAIENMTADWNANALAKAKLYQDTMAMSPSAIHDQLTSEYGEKFTVEQADYAIAHLND